MDTSPATYLSLCSGIGGLDLFARSLGWECATYVEWDSYCQQVLQARIRDGWLDDAPIWDDLRSFDARPFAGLVDALVAGFPCQPFSTAGRRRGDADDRNLWPEVRRIIGEARPRIVFLENVYGLLTRNGRDPGYAWTIIADLAALGYVGRWTVVAARDAGAPHRRDRWFCLAYADGERGVGRGDRQGGPDRDAQRRAGDDGETPRGRDELAHSPGGGRQEGVPHDDEGQPDAAGSGAVADPERGGHHGGPSLTERRPEGRTPAAGASEGVGDAEDDGRPRGGGTRAGGAGLADPGFPPGPADTAGWRTYLEEWPALEPAIRRGDDGVSHRVQRLRALGNAVVWQQARLAWEVLTS